MQTTTHKTDASFEGSVRCHPASLNSTKKINGRIPPCLRSGVSLPLFHQINSFIQSLKNGGYYESNEIIFRNGDVRAISRNCAGRGSFCDFMNQLLPDIFLWF